MCLRAAVGEVRGVPIISRIPTHEHAFSVHWNSFQPQPDCQKQRVSPVVHRSNDANVVGKTGAVLS